MSKGQAPRRFHRCALNLFRLRSLAGRVAGIGGRRASKSVTSAPALTCWCPDGSLSVGQFSWRSAASKNQCREPAEESTMRHPTMSHPTVIEFPKVKFLLIPLILAAAATTTVAAKVEKPVTQWACADFLSVDDQFKPKVVYWAAAYAKGGQPEAAVIDIRGIEKVTPELIGQCKKAPQASFWTRLKDEWRKVEAETEAETKKIEKKL
jgi:acid stress chaperone HdeA